MIHDNVPLPDGWIRDFDHHSKLPFWVDTKAKPPRSIWVHPYEDEQFLQEHPGLRDPFVSRPADIEDAPPPYSRRHSYGGSPSGSSHLNVPSDGGAMRPSQSQPATPGEQQHRGFFGKLKDKAIGTKEERQARRQEENRKYEAYVRQLAEQRRLRQEAWSQPMPGFGVAYGGPRGYSQSMYAPPSGGRLGRTGGFGGGLGMPLLAGAAGGLLLGELLDGPGWGGGLDGGFDGGFDGGGGNFF